MLVALSLVATVLLALLATVPSPVAQAAAGDAATAQTLTALTGAAGAPVAAYLVNALVKPFTTDVRFYTPAAVLFGIFWNLLVTLALAEVTGAHIFWFAAVVLGVLTGQAASGIVSATRAEVNQDMAARGAVVLPNPPPKQGG